MKTFDGKRWLATVLAVLMLCGMPAVASVGVSAAPTGYTDIQVWETQTVALTVSQPVKYLRFIPEADGDYCFYSTGFMDTYGVLMDADEDVLYSDDDSGEEQNFSMTCYLYEGNVYYLGLSIYSNGTGIFDVTVESVEPDPVDPTVIEIAAGENIEVTAQAVEEYQYFMFSPDASGWYAFTSSGPCDTNVELFGYPNIRNSNDGEGQNFRAVTYCEAGGEYNFYTYLNDVYGGTYTVSVNAVDEDALFPDAMAIEEGDSSSVYLDQWSGSAVYRFIPETAGEYTIYTTGDADPYCYLYDVEYGWVTMADDYYYTDDFNVVLTYEFAAGETYYFLFTAYDTGLDFAEYEVHLQSGGFDALKAEQIFADNTQTVYPAHPEASQYYAFVPTESDWYRFEMGTEGFLAAELRDADENLLEEADSGEEADDFYMIHYCEAGEVYYIGLATYGEEVPMYTVTVTEADENNLFPDAEVITAGQIKTVEAAKYYRFVPTVSGAYTFYSSGESDTRCTLYDVANGMTSDYDDIDYEMGDCNFRFTYNFVADQVYYFYVDTYYEGEGPFEVALSFENEVVVVESIDITGLRAPQAEETVYDYSDHLWSLTADPNLPVGDVAVFQGLEMMDDYATFAAGETYTVGLAFDEYSCGVLFIDGCTVTVNEGTLMGCAKVDGWLVIYVDITVPTDEPIALLGDADGNGRVNNRDLGRMQQYLNDWDVDIDLIACDMDGNGRVNNRDLGTLQQMLNE